MQPSAKQFVLTHIAEKVSTLTAENKHSDAVKHFNIPWKIRYRRSERLFTMALCCSQPRTDRIWTAATQITFKILSVNGNHVSNTVSYTFANDSEFGCFGHLNCQWDTVLKQFVVDDKLILEVHVTIESMTGIERPEKLKHFDRADRKFTDVVLKVGDEKFHVSKVVLAGQSTHFKRLLIDNSRQAKQSDKSLEGVTSEDFQVFLELVYMEDTLTDSNIEDVLKLVEKYEAKNPARLCEQFLILDSNHSLKTKMRIAEQYQFQKLKTHCLSNMKCRADVRAVMGTDASAWDAPLLRVLLERLFQLNP
ncbi:hypothetical protein CAEBREN_19434 [Caenorhabditis brenneri]|uniref:BTB domain-containing protein n=1 Tax=Caenorhabditis brenneri TaxID=135651 RepID=G0PFY4_CAEBE|nr:hypothetical protein CAEBREN_19434 [Caenorhabditis brenneri]